MLGRSPIWLAYRVCQDAQPVIDVPSSAALQHSEAAPVVMTSRIQASSSQELFSAQTAGNLVDAVTTQDSYPVEYDPFNRSVEVFFCSMLLG